MKDKHLKMGKHLRLSNQLQTDTFSFTKGEIKSLLIIASRAQGCKDKFFCTIIRGLICFFFFSISIYFSLFISGGGSSLLFLLVWLFGFFFINHFFFIRNLFFLRASFFIFLLAKVTQND